MKKTILTMIIALFAIVSYGQDIYVSQYINAGGGDTKTPTIENQIIVMHWVDEQEVSILFGDKWEIPTIRGSLSEPTYYQLEKGIVEEYKMYSWNDLEYEFSIYKTKSGQFLVVFKQLNTGVEIKLFAKSI